MVYFESNSISFFSRVKPDDVVLLILFSVKLHELETKAMSLYILMHDSLVILHILHSWEIQSFVCLALILMCKKCFFFNYKNFMLLFLIF